MKTIRSKQQLQEEKRRLKQRQEDLEKAIRQDWADLKYTLKPSSLAKEAVDHFIDKKMERSEKDGGLLKSTLSYGIATLAQKLVDKATSKFGKKGNTPEDY